MVFLGKNPKEMGAKVTKSRGAKGHPKATKPATKHPPPEGDPLRKFYVSLFRQRPSSKMAIDWLCSNGLAHVVIDIQNLQLAR